MKLQPGHVGRYMALGLSIRAAFLMDLCGLGGFKKLSMAFSEAGRDRCSC